MKRYKILAKSSSAVLLKINNTATEMFKVLDVEEEVIYLGSDSERAMNIFNSYNIEEVRKTRKELFERWLKENAEA